MDAGARRAGEQVTSVFIVHETRILCVVGRRQMAVHSAANYESP